MKNLIFIFVLIFGLFMFTDCVFGNSTVDPVSVEPHAVLTASSQLKKLDNIKNMANDYLSDYRAGLISKPTTLNILYALLYKLDTIEPVNQKAADYKSSIIEKTRGYISNMENGAVRKKPILLVKK